MSTKGIIGVLVVVVIAFIAGLYFMPSTDVPTTTDTTPMPGAVSTNQPTEPFYFQGGLTGQARAFVSTTTVACMIQNPLSATTTFAMISADVPVSTTTTTVLNIATSTNANRFATSSNVLSTRSLAGTKGTLTYRPTTNNDILGPNEWIQVGYGAGTTLPTVAQQQTGSCAVVFNILR